jgi:hypothetical protein
MIIGLLGYAQSGKDAVAKTLVEEHGFIRIAFADKIRELLYEMDLPVPMKNGDKVVEIGLQNLVDELGWDDAKQHPLVRAMLQNLGVGARTIFHENFWVVEAFKLFDTQDKDYVVTDVRFKNEADTIQRLGGEMWRVVRPGVGPVNNHVSENELDNSVVNTTITNSGTLEDLKNLVRKEIGA